MRRFRVEFDDEILIVDATSKEVARELALVYCTTLHSRMGVTSVKPIYSFWVWLKDLFIFSPGLVRKEGRKNV